MKFPSIRFTIFAIKQRNSYRKPSIPFVKFRNITTIGDRDTVRSSTTQALKEQKTSKSPNTSRIGARFTANMELSTLPPTKLLFQRNAKLHVLDSTILTVLSIADLAESDRGLYKQANADTDHAVVTGETIFHPQGGGQPSDVGTITIANEPTAEAAFEVVMARHSISSPNHVLHFGRFKTPDQKSAFQPGQQITQSINSEKRLLYSKYHTAGHTLGAAVRHLLEKQIEGFDELKASHFPDSASCEFKGLIDGKYKESIQKKLDEYIDAKMDVEIDWWGREDFEREGLTRLIPEGYTFNPEGPENGKLRMVKIAGAEVYPCGGTHVDTTDQCGKTTVKRISRQKGTSKVSYAVAA